MARPSISQASSGFFFVFRTLTLPAGPSIAPGRCGGLRYRTSLAGVASTRSWLGPAYSTLRRSRRMALPLSFWITTSTGRMPNWLGLSLPKASATLSVADVGVHTDGNLCVALVAGVTAGGGGLEGRLLVRRKSRGYTQEKSQAFENKRHLFPLPGPSGVLPARPPIVFRLARHGEPRLLAQLAGAVRISSPFV